MSDFNQALIDLNKLPTASDVIVLQSTNQHVVDTKNLELDSASPVYGQFNLGLHVGDNRATVHDNRSSLLQFLQSDFPKLSRINWLNQVHGDSVYHVTEQISCLPVAADAQITTLSNVALAIMTADCVPVMIATGSSSNNNRVIAAIHAGWQGIAKNIISHTVQKMVHQFDFVETQTNYHEMQTITQGWQAWVGASIAQPSYEVDDKVRLAVLEAVKSLDITINEIADELFVPNPQRKGHYFADLSRVVALQLNACGIHQVHLSQLDSFTDPRFYSYRQQTKNQQPATGRMAALIFMR